ncbi:ABC transporter ATP-binding protein [Acaryochloris sp. 'Moss Beach']|nr:ABC transporter ATP-binding protein [Acaryochloris sp. 'Moss Beach']
MVLYSVKKCLERFLQLEISFYNNTGPGKLLGYVNDHSNRSEKLFSAILEIAREIILLTALVIFLITLSPVMTIFTGISLLAVAFVLKLFIVRGVQRYGQNTARDLNDFSDLTAEILNGIRLIKTFSSESHELKRIKKVLWKRYSSELNAYKFNSAVAPLTETTGIMVLLGMLLVGNYFLNGDNKIALPILLTYILTLLRTLPRVNHLSSLRSQLSLLWGSFETIEKFLIGTSTKMLSDGEKKYGSLTSTVEFSNITFAYPGNNEPVVRDFNLVIPKGNTVALVGQSGSGKSTLVDLLLRLYDPDIGSIFVDGIDLRHFTRKSWHQAIAVVSQDTFLFNETVRENIAYGVRKASDEKIIEAARKAHALDFIKALPNGFDTIVGNRGTLLSGGQRQRIAIARAILCQPDLLILDEATSALDSKSERIIQTALEEISEECTVVVIAHRLSTIERADQIILLQEGKILEKGMHNELIDAKGLYYSLHTLQASNSIATIF